MLRQSSSVCCADPDKNQSSAISAMIFSVMKINSRVERATTEVDTRFHGPRHEKLFGQVRKHWPVTPTFYQNPSTEQQLSTVSDGIIRLPLTLWAAN